jgi:prepilin-type N-terminal cleavage/methylation domain-containing protein
MTEAGYLLICQKCKCAERMGKSDVLGGCQERKRRGYSLLELMISLALMGVILSMVSISLLHQSPKYRLKSAIWQIHSHLNYARYKSIFKGMKYRVQFDLNGYCIEKFDETHGEWVGEQKNLYQGVFIEATNNPIFHPRGTVSNLASITVANSWGRYKISIAISGRIKITQLDT